MRFCGSGEKMLRALEDAISPQVGQAEKNGRARGIAHLLRGERGKLQRHVPSVPFHVKGF
jgi:hypothetical protein